MHLFFDLDGTLTDPFLGITASIQYALERLGRPVPAADALRWCIGPPLKESFQQLLAADGDETGEDSADTALNFYRERFSRVGIYENSVYTGIPDVLATLKARGHHLLVATAKPTVFAKRIVDHFDLDHLFKSIYGSELDGTRSNKAELIAHILQLEGIEASESKMIGDRQHDVIGARANGVPGYGVLWGYGTKAELQAAGARACLETPGELLIHFD